MSTLRTKRLSSLAVAVAASALGVTLAACGSGGSSPTASSSSTTPPAADASNGGGSFPGASGSVAALSGSSMEVQNQQTGQVTVSWTSATTFSKTVTVASSSVAAGDCVTVSGSSSNGIITANTVMISQPSSSGSCTNAFPGSRRPSGSTTRGTFPSGGSGGRPFSGSGSPPSGFGNFGFASGTVTSVNASTVVVDGFSSAGFRPGTTSTTTPTTTKTTVDLSSSTKYQETQSGSAADLAVGDCVTATGTTGSTGAVSASTIRITSTGGQTCTVGFGAAGGFPGGGGGSTSG